MTDTRTTGTSEPGGTATALDFWGTRVTVLTAHEADTAYLRWFHRDHLAAHPACPAAAVPDLELHLAADNNSGFFAALLGTAAKTVLIRRPDTGWQVYERFGARSTRPTPLPPFHLEPCRSRVTVHHGAVIVDDTGAIALTGPSGTGKTSLALALAADGAALLTDDLLVRRRTDGHALPCTRPLTLREAVWPHLPDAHREALRHGTRRRTADGHRVLHVRPDDLGIRVARTPEPVRLVVTLTRAPAIEYRRTPGALHVRCDPAAGHLADVARHVKETARAAAQPR